MRYIDLRGILTGLVVAIICWAATQLGRLVDLAVPDLARRMARAATRIVPEADRDFYNFESDIEEALSGHHQYTAFRLALGSLMRVAPHRTARQKWATASFADRAIIKACFSQLASIVTIATSEFSPLSNLPLVSWSATAVTGLMVTSAFFSAAQHWRAEWRTRRRETRV